MFGKKGARNCVAGALGMLPNVAGCNVLEPKTEEQIRETLAEGELALNEAKWLLNSIDDWFLGSIVALLVGFLVARSATAVLLMKIRQEFGRIADALEAGDGNGGSID